jgi:hypothetical protein
MQNIYNKTNNKRSNDSENQINELQIKNIKLSGNKETKCLATFIL